MDLGIWPMKKMPHDEHRQCLLRWTAGGDRRRVNEH